MNRIVTSAAIVSLAFAVGIGAASAQGYTKRGNTTGTHTKPATAPATVRPPVAQHAPAPRTTSAAPHHANRFEPPHHRYEPPRRHHRWWSWQRKWW